MNSAIMNEELEVSMTLGFPLHGYFSKEQKWKLIYSGSKHGFKSPDFHSRCDSVKNTVTIIKTTDDYVFGGYTDEAWSSTGGSKKDVNAFLFSLVKNKVISYKVMKCIEPEKAIHCQSTYGPIFGTGHLEGGHDLCIRTPFDKSLNYSNLGRSYNCPGQQHPKGGVSTLCQSYLAGSHTFQVKEIEVYCKYK